MPKRGHGTRYHKAARRNALGSYDGPRASDVKITKADGTTSIEPAKAPAPPKRRRPATRGRRR